MDFPGPRNAMDRAQRHAVDCLRGMLDDYAADPRELDAEPLQRSIFDKLLSFSARPHMGSMNLTGEQRAVARDILSQGASPAPQDPDGMTLNPLASGAILVRLCESLFLRMDAEEYTDTDLRAAVERLRDVYDWATMLSAKPQSYYTRVYAAPSTTRAIVDRAMTEKTLVLDEPPEVYDRIFLGALSSKTTMLDTDGRPVDAQQVMERPSLLAFHGYVGMDGSEQLWELRVPHVPRDESGAA